ncbi:tRNA N6-adenosine threonylcarbamoyltransferase [archaeon]|nr:tRNA N6-adenosine threonylcarbamoyltransferase [archaeon]
MKCLGIEATAEKLGIGIVNNKSEILTNITKYKPLTTGIHPREAAQHHADNIKDLIKEALQKVELSFKDIDLISFSQGPGLGPSLRVAAVTARTLALKYSLPLVGVNHCVAHIEIGRLKTEARDPLTVYVSGGNTQITAFVSGRYRVFGETLDIALGNLIDQFARTANLSNPGGPVVEKLAKKGNYIELPYTVKGMDLSYSGLLTAAKRALNNYSVEDVCYSLQEVSFSMLVEVTERALAHTGKGELLIAGGVGVNRRLQEMLNSMADERGSGFFTTPENLLGDNGAMIAWLGILEYTHGKRMKPEDSFVRQRWRTDEVEVLWR